MATKEKVKVYTMDEFVAKWTGRVFDGLIRGGTRGLRSEVYDLIALLTDRDRYVKFKFDWEK